ncbi:DUF4280 domain-containing protein [Anaerosinus massiliensis]|uniref:DUF4280 domain-containing protein n=1 Tax=Massilibacillus massiliensis TaxID=1806837 RepID=UPI0018FF068E|nr:DUF4280 domain-containing protein [Massilibacillus massiliensis]
MSSVANGQGEKYVVDGATIQCSAGTSVGKLHLPYSHKATINGKKVLTIQDNQSLACIGCMGQCKNRDQLPPCVPSTNMQWQQGKATVCLGSTPALLSTAIIVCSHGGVIKVVADGQ